MKATFDNTVSILVIAYLNNELQHGDCSMCAVGNIVAAAGAPRSYGGTFDCGDASCWKWAFYTESTVGVQNIKIYGEEAFEEAMQVIEPTGYKWEDLAKIEFAFETALRGNSDDEWMFNGLMAVVDVLAEIHNINLEQKESAKLLFVKQP